MSADDPALDATAIAELRDQLGDEVLAKVLDAYLDELPRYLGELRSGLANGDVQAVVRAAHSLKGASRLVGGTAFADACQAVEAAAGGEGLDGLGPQVTEIERMAAAVGSAVRSQLPN